ncbi:MAG: hypothetical protein Q9221_000360 [Calogaya cf. arnoldii]
MSSQDMEDLKSELAQSYDIKNPLHVSLMLGTVRKFMLLLQKDESSQALLKENHLLGQFCDFVSRDKVFKLVEPVVPEFRMSKDEREEILKHSKTNEDSPRAECLMIILNRLEDDRRLPPRFRYGTCFRAEAALLRSRQLRWMQYLYSEGRGIDPESSRNEEIREWYNGVEECLRPAAAAAAAFDNIIPKFTFAPVPGNEVVRDSEDDGDEEMDG